MKYLFTYVMYKNTTSYRLTEMTDGLSVIHELNARIIPTKNIWNTDKKDAPLVMDWALKDQTQVFPSLVILTWDKPVPMPFKKVWAKTWWASTF